MLAFIVAAYQRSVDRVQQLFDRGQPVAAADVHRPPPLHHAADAEDWTPLADAASEGDVDRVRLLLEAGAPAAATDAVRHCTSQLELAMAVWWNCCYSMAP
uniref:Uncharacterized protein n=1 Tax=Tetradesmus obliquus TaxID=3088 RepID=A0A383WKQ1_TETOB|eukprot:jgi/Sobl393_1/19051/SZX77792.1